MGEAKTLIAGIWEFHGFSKLKDPPFTEGSPPEFMVFTRDEYFEQPSIYIIGTNSAKIEMFKKVLGWYWPKTEKEVFELLKDLEKYHEKSLTIQWHDDFMERLKKNHIDFVDGHKPAFKQHVESEKHYRDFENGTILFRKQPADLEKLGIKETRIVPSIDKNSGPGFKGKLFIISDGTTEIYWDWDNHWYCGGWELSKATTQDYT